jgi:ActR/RegA family two-component response regulator
MDDITCDSISTVAQDELVIFYFKDNLLEINAAIEILKRKNKDQKIIILSTLRSMDTALELFNKGISDYILMDSEWESNIKAELIKHSIYCYSRKKIE